MVLAGLLKKNEQKLEVARISEKSQMMNKKINNGNGGRITVAAAANERMNGDWNSPQP
ncbi:hypothetical protein F2Q69_00049748 [Brassica cretica]|uniref:Uncharacterized protein n=1 Tax=Brassica cretica TaxID=69181 RepID=A0A8S9PUM7_BRACR|nr:hypothetical protein F2Q69_00049748 [Brassica cretica]